jgi:hypothetical protein
MDQEEYIYLDQDGTTGQKIEAIASWNALPKLRFLVTIRKS